jgi:4-aminobutyrate---pyruvate transaminase
MMRRINSSRVIWSSSQERASAVSTSSSSFIILRVSLGVQRRTIVAESEKIGTFGHGFTYSGHPVATAVALETLKIYEERDIVGHVQNVAPLFQRRLRALAEHPLVGNARGRGLIGTLELVRNKETKETFSPANGVAIHAGKRAQAHGVVTRAMGDNHSLCPPLIITEAQINDMFDRSEKALDDTYTWARANNLYS